MDWSDTCKAVKKRSVAGVRNEGVTVQCVLIMRESSVF